MDRAFSPARTTPGTTEEKSRSKIAKPFCFSFLFFSLSCLSGLRVSASFSLSLSCLSVMLAFFQRADTRPDLSFRFDFMLVQKDRPGPVRIFQPRVDAPARAV